jgi:hypothetical protein
VSYCPTLVVSFGGISGERYWYQEDEVWEDARLQTFHPKRAVDAVAMRRQKADDRDYHHRSVAAAVAELYRRGVRTTIGAHGQRHGLAFHWEMGMFAQVCACDPTARLDGWVLTGPHTGGRGAQGGLTPYQVLRSATRNAAEALGLGASTGPQLGLIAEGAIADLVIWPPEASPLVSINNTVALSHIVKDGRLYLVRRRWQRDKPTRLACLLTRRWRQASTMAEVYPTARPLPAGPVLDTPVVGATIARRPADEDHIEL